MQLSGSDLPLVTAICPTTARRREWLPKAIECFQGQAYPNCEMVIVSEDDLSDLMPKDERIRLIRCVPRLLIGAKRNICCEHARGEIIAHFDDDDWSGPGRIADQVATLQMGRAVTGYNPLRFTDGKHWWIHSTLTGFVFGTTLCYRRDFWKTNPFHERTRIGEDMYFFTAAIRVKQLFAVPDDRHMYATNHAGNTSIRAVTGPTWQEIEAAA